MGRRLNISQPTVINTELAPLDDSFTIVPSGQIEQWYYDNTGQYAPNRQITPLTLTPVISAFDPDTNTELSPSFSSAPKWYVTEYVTTGQTSGYKESEITDTTDGQNVMYYKSGNTLRVKKNVSYSYAVQIRCVATYIDPRDVGLTYDVEATITLSTNRNASVVYPSLEITNPSTRSYNPLMDASSQFTFTAKAKKGDTDVTNSTYFVWYAVNGTVEVLANTMHWYVSGQNTATLTVNAMYGEEIKVVLRAKENAQAANLYPDKAYGNIMWKIPDIDTNVISDEGGAVRNSTTSMTFRPVVNVRKSVLADAAVDEHLRFNWKYRKSNLSSVTDAGWGKQVTLTASDVRNVNGNSNTPASTSVYPIVYILGAYQEVTHNGATVTHNGATVFNRYVGDGQ